jgi:hypothetical protein
LQIGGRGNGDLLSANRHAETEQENNDCYELSCLHDDYVRRDWFASWPLVPPSYMKGWELGEILCQTGLEVPTHAAGDHPSPK